MASGRHNKRRSSTSRAGGLARRAVSAVPRTAHGWAKRAQSRRAKVLALSAAALIVLAVAVGFLVQSYISVQPRALVDEAKAYVARADINIIQMDDVLNSQVTTATLGEIASIRPGVKVAVDALEAAQDLLERAKSKDASTTTEVRLLERAIDARLDMLALAPPLVSLTERAGDALVSAAAGYDTLTLAAEQSAAAKSSFNPKSDGALERTRASSENALDLYREARLEFEAADVSLPESDLSSYLAYLDLSIQMAQSLQGACDYLIRDEPTRANAKIRQFNELESRASAAAAQLEPIEALVEAGYASAAGTISTDYSAARDKVLELDNLVR